MSSWSQNVQVISIMIDLWIEIDVTIFSVSLGPGCYAVVLLVHDNNLYAPI
jgi:hypothetical protein